MATKTPKLGQRGTYTGRDGFQRAALVIGTHESVQDGTGVTRPAEGNVNVLVYRPKDGSTYTRTNVAVGTGKGQISR